MTHPKRDGRSQNHLPMIHTSTEVQHNLLCRFQIALSFKLQCLALLLPVLICSLCLKSKSTAWMLNTKKTLDCILEGESMQFLMNWEGFIFGWFSRIVKAWEILTFSFSLYDSFLWFPSLLPLSFYSFLPSFVPLFLVNTSKFLKCMFNYIWDNWLHFEQVCPFNS